MKTKINFDGEIENSYDHQNTFIISSYINSFRKRIIDVILSIFILILLSPLLLLIGILIKLTSIGPIFYKWAIVGKNSKIVYSYKFRTMVKNAEDFEFTLRNNKLNEMDNIYFKMKYDPRITLFGKFLRKFSFDELPSFYSVLIGDLSIVGPRPVRPHECEKMNSWQKIRLNVKPGITSLWVVSGKNKITNFNKIVEMDLHYIANSSLLVDLNIIVKTVFVMLLGQNY